MFHRKKTVADAAKWPATEYRPAVKRSICTGEAVFGFIRRSDDSFTDICLVRDEDIPKLLAQYGHERSELVEIY